MKTEFSKEKLIFAAAVLFLAAAVYQHFATQPAALVVGLPVSAQLAPVKLPEKPLAETHLSLAGGRKTPFAPPVPDRKINPKPPDRPEITRRGGGAVIPPVPPDLPNNREPIEEVVVAPPAKPNLNFVGIASTDSQTVALIRSEKGSPRLVKVGDEAAAKGYTVARIEKQSIQIDGRERIVLKDR